MERTCFIGIKDEFGTDIRLNLGDVVAYHNFPPQKKEGEVTTATVFPTRIHIRGKGSVTLKYKSSEKADGLLKSIDEILKKDSMIFFYE